MRTGVHCSIRNGFVGALEEAMSLGCETFQMFTQSPRGWMTRVYTENEFKDFRKAREASGIFPVVVHAPYLPNLCTSDETLYQKSLQALKADLSRCEKLGAEFLVVHPGAFSPQANLEEGLRRIISAFNGALAEVPGTSRILVENMAGGGRRVGGPFAHIARILDGVKDKKRIGVCLDTCHTLAAGYDISTAEGVRTTLNEFETEIGLGHLYVFHVNDSKAPLGSHRDRHEHIGQGHVGEKGFRFLFEARDFDRCSFILETPKDPAPTADLNNLKKLRSCLSVVHEHV